MPLQIDQVEYTVTANGTQQVIFPNLTETMKAVTVEEALGARAHR